MKLEKVRLAPPDLSGFGPPVHVQGGYLRARGRDRLVESGGRFKLDCPARTTLFVLSGEGSIKWARGETPFSAGDAFCIEETGETELNGACAFLFSQE